MALPLSNEPLDLAVAYFRSLDLSDPRAQGDELFGRFGPGNLIDGTDRPYERFTDYERLLSRLQAEDPHKYGILHKGTPFFFLFWLAFLLRNYEKALYYLDAAILEDVKNHKDWENCAAARLLKLSEPEVAKNAWCDIREILTAELNRFNGVSGLEAITIDAFANKFATPLLRDPSGRTILTAFYVLLMEHKERLIELRLKSTAGSSLGPLIAHLFSGCLILESLLISLYLKDDKGKSKKTLGVVFSTKAFKRDFGCIGGTSAKELEEVWRDIPDDSHLTAFRTAGKVRNTTGHSLIWNKDLATDDHYEKLYRQISNALLYLIHKKYVTK